MEGTYERNLYEINWEGIVQILGENVNIPRFFPFHSYSISILIFFILRLDLKNVSGTLLYNVIVSVSPKNFAFWNKFEESFWTSNEPKFFNGSIFSLKNEPPKAMLSPNITGLILHWKQLRSVWFTTMFNETIFKVKPWALHTAHKAWNLFSGWSRVLWSYTLSRFTTGGFWNYF